MIDFKCFPRFYFRHVLIIYHIIDGWVGGNGGGGGGDYCDVIMRAIASQIAGVLIVCSNFCSGADQRKHQNSAPLAFVRGIHRWPVDYPHWGRVTRKIFPFDDVIMGWGWGHCALRYKLWSAISISYSNKLFALCYNKYLYFYVILWKLYNKLQAEFVPNIDELSHLFLFCIRTRLHSGYTKAILSYSNNTQFTFQHTWTQHMLKFSNGVWNV